MITRGRGRLAWLLPLWLVVAACAADGSRTSVLIGSEPFPPPDLPHRAASSHVEVYWTCDRTDPGTMRIAGLARNPWSSQPVQYLEFDAAGLDRDGRVVSEGYAAVPAYFLGTNQVTRFLLGIRPSGREVRYDLYYQYRFEEPDLDARLAGPGAGRQLIAARLNRFAVRDACAETQHRAR
jgi:hypothetical protein